MVTVKKLKSVLSLFGASGYRYCFSLFSFDNIHGVEDAFPCEGAVFVFARRSYDFLRFRFTCKLLYCGSTKNMSSLSVSKLSRRCPELISANCIGVLYEGDAKHRGRLVSDISHRNFT